MLFLTLNLFPRVRNRKSRREVKMVVQLILLQRVRKQQTVNNEIFQWTLIMNSSSRSLSSFLFHHNQSHQKLMIFFIFLSGLDKISLYVKNEHVMCFHVLF